MLWSMRGLAIHDYVVAEHAGADDLGAGTDLDLIADP